MRFLFFLFASVLLLGCAENQPKSYRTQTNIGELTISVELLASHPFLDEHDKRVNIKKGGEHLVSFSAPDTGGFSSIYVFEDGGQLLVVDGLANGKAIDQSSGVVSEIDPDKIPWDIPERSLGQFSFVEGAVGYKWVAH